MVCLTLLQSGMFLHDCAIRLPGKMLGDMRSSQALHMRPRNTDESGIFLERLLYASVALWLAKLVQKHGLGGCIRSDSKVRLDSASRFIVDHKLCQAPSSSPDPE